MRNRSLFAAVVALSALLLATALSPRGQTPPQNSQPNQAPPTGLIAGQVLDGDTGRPISNATVVMTGRPAAPVARGPVRAAGARGGPVPAMNDRVLVNGDGWFVFAGLPAGSYTLIVQARGYVTGRPGQRRLDGPSAPINLGDRQVLTDATVKLWKVAAISGTVVDEAGEPAVETTVRALRVTTRGGRRLILPIGTDRTDDRGMYRIANVVPGTYLIVIPHTLVNVPASLVAAFAAARAAGTSSELSQQLSVSGAPSPYSIGQAIGDQMLLTSGALGAQASLPTSSGTGPIMTYPTTFYPAATTVADAQSVTVASGQERAGIDLRLQPVPTVAVSGTVTGPGRPAVNMGVHLIPAGDSDFLRTTGFDTATTATDASGAFTFVGVPSGQYTATVSKIPRPTLQRTSVTIATGGGTVIMGMSGSSPASAPTPIEPALWGEATVSVGDTDVGGVAITLRAGARLGGRVAFEGGGAPPTGRALQSIAVTASPADGHMLPFMTAGRVNADGQFTTMGYPPGRYFIQVLSTAAPGWTLQSVTLGGRNVDGQAITLGSEDLGGIVATFTTQPNQVNGTVHSTTGTAAKDATVFLFPADVAAWFNGGMSSRRMHTVTVAKDGRFSVTGIPPGQYAIAAVASDEIGDEQDIKFYEALARIGTRVTVDATGTHTLDLTLGHIR